jgi:hypothetical protein
MISRGRRGLRQDRPKPTKLKSLLNPAELRSDSFIMEVTMLQRILVRPDFRSEVSEACPDVLAQTTKANPPVLYALRGRTSS